MKLVELENERLKLHETLAVTLGRRRIYYLNEFLTTLNRHSNQILLNTYFLEFLETYIDELSCYSPFGVHNSLTNQILLELKIIIETQVFDDFQSKLIECYENITTKYNKLESALSGEKANTETECEFYVPLLEENDKIDNECFGIMEALSVSISKTDGKNKFTFLPSTKNIDDVLSKQVKTSLEAALVFIKTEIKRPHKYHEVIVKFENLDFHIKGNSLGSALTLLFISKLLQLYNSKRLYSLIQSCAFTGSCDSTLSIGACGTDSIVRKCAVVFFSPIEQFVLPEKDYAAALDKLSELQKEFPKRELTLIPVKNIEDIITRRNIINIKKQNIVFRSVKTAAQHYYFSIIIFLLIVVIGYNFYDDYDDNPATIEGDTTTLYVKNKSGKTLWKLKTSLDSHPSLLQQQMSISQKLVDIDDDDGVNEIILICENLDELDDKAKFHRIACYNYKKEVVWDYVFRDSVESKLEKLLPEYGPTAIFDTTTINGRKAIIYSVSNGPSFSSAIVTLDLKTGERFGTTFWHSGHIIGGFIKDIDNDGVKEVVFAAINNGYEKIAVGAVEVNNINGYAPSTDKYIILKKPKAKLDFYYLLPNTDYSNYLNQRNSFVYPGRFFNQDNLERMSVNTSESGSPYAGGVVYRMRYDLNDVNLFIGSDFRVLRDSVVAKGLLSYPLTDTPEYCELLASQILYWTGSEFVGHKKYLSLKEKKRKPNI